jgi:hypothetical protein
MIIPRQLLLAAWLFLRGIKPRASRQTATLGDYSGVVMGERFLAR